MAEYSEERRVAIEAVLEASKLCGAVRSDLVTVESMTKNDRSPVTVADFGSQAIVCRHVKEAFGSDPIVGEEDAAELRSPEHRQRLEQVVGYVRRLRPEATADTVCDWIDLGNGAVADRFWTLDPIDGTKGFLRNDQYAVALALIENGEVKLGVLGCPALPLDLEDPDGERGVIFLGVRGQGAVMAPLGSGDFRPIRVMRPSESSRLRFVESVEADHGNTGLQQAVASAVGIASPPLRMDSQAKYGAVARGDAALYLRLPSPKHPDYREKIWDHAAGCLIVEEAGGRVTDMHGNPLDLASDARMNGNRGVIASQGDLHEGALAALARS